MCRIELVKTELEKLDNFLKNNAKYDARLTVSEVHGLLCAIVSSPNLIMPRYWMQIIIGSKPNFKNLEEACEIIDIIMKLNNAVSHDLHHKGSIDMALFENGVIYSYRAAREHLISKWCLGYLRGASMDKVWGDNAALLLPFTVLSGEFDLTQIKDDEDSLDIEDDAEIKRHFRNYLMNHIYHIFNFWGKND